MSIRRINYTGRKRILAEDVSIAIAPTEQGDLTFRAYLELGRYGFPPNADLLIEAYRASRYERFAFGKVALADDALTGTLEFFRVGEIPLFRVKVVDSSERHGVLLAEADRVHPTGNLRGPSRRISLLPTESAELGPQVWRLNLEDSPILQVNSALGDWRGLVTSREFATLAYPGILREVLLQIVVVDGASLGDDLYPWQHNWLTFASSIRSAPQFPQGTVTDQARRDWVEDVLSAFCRSQNCLTKAIAIFASEAA